ncbi:MAG: D-alanyl-D-alanine carboxypeptidase/D-alanyl-D-alanine-endopeptidase [Flavobacteriales bacterium]|nr:D-alanyl-D-alanine carboxypeptidase/D-alanyl-D-alanine-endopeptidase [Flavobacteriales bacterium]
MIKRILKSKAAWISLIAFATLLNIWISWDSTEPVIIPVDPEVKVVEQDTISPEEKGTDIILNVDLKGIAALKAYIKKLENTSEMKHANWGFMVAPLKGDTVYAQHNGPKSLVPASIMKAVTTSVAMEVLGPDFRFKTELLYLGAINKVQGTLDGDIYIRGFGDPTLGSTDFPNTQSYSIMRQWYAEFEKLGIDTIKGRIVGDAHNFEFEMFPASWAWEDIQGGYCAGVSGLSFRENLFSIGITTNADTVFANLYTDIPEYEIVNNLIKNKKKTHSAIWVASSPYTGHSFLYGQVSSDKKKYGVKCPIPDPALLVAHTFHKYLEKKGIVILEKPSTVRRLNLSQHKNEKAIAIKSKLTPVIFHTTYSPTLLTIINITNTISHNFFAESILKQVAWKRTSHGSTKNGYNTIKDYFKRKRVNVNGFHQFDGSGMSRFNSVSPEFMVDMLISSSKSKTFDEYYNSLPVVGRTGTVRGMCHGTLAQGNIHAKSGYMTRVRSYVGYVKTKSGEMLAFSMIANNYKCSPYAMRKHFEKLMILMAKLE